MTGIESIEFATAAAITALTPGVAAYVLAKANAGRLDRQADKIDKLNNGGGRAIVEGILREHRLIDPPNQNPSTVKVIVPASSDAEGKGTE